MSTFEGLGLPNYPSANVTVDAGSDDLVWSWGRAAATQKSFDMRWYGDGASGATYLYWDASADTLIFYDGAIKFDGGGVANLITADAAASALFKAVASGDGGIVATADGMSQDPETASEDGYIKVYVGASLYEVPMYLNT